MDKTDWIVAIVLCLCYWRMTFPQLTIKIRELFYLSIDYELISSN